MVLTTWYLLPPKERYLLVIFISIFFVSGGVLATQFFFSHTTVEAQEGGEYREGVVGNPRYINPVLAPTDEADRDLAELIFSGLMKYNERGEIVPDLAERLEVKEGGKVYEFTLRESILWQDGEPVKINDVAFTIDLVQDPRYQSPLRINWQGVEVEKGEGRIIRFKLKNPYAPFIENTTIGILPKHIWEGIDPKKFPLAEPNLKPVGSGPYKLIRIKKDARGTVKSVTLARNENYYDPKPYMKRLTFLFLNNEDEAVAAYNNHEVDGLSYISAGHIAKLRSLKSLTLLSLNLPRYYAIFFNQSQSRVLTDKAVRVALARGLDKADLVETLLGGKARVIDSPILPGLIGYTDEVKKYEFSPEEARANLEAIGWKDENNDGIREKGTDTLTIKLITVESPELPQVTEIIKNSWGAVGVDTQVEVLGIGEIEERIRARTYDALLFGEALGHDPDPFSFWHSSQKKDPGLNLALYSNKDVDKLLEEARQESNPDIRAEKYRAFSRIITEDIPAVFLYSPDYIYPVTKRVKGIGVTHIVDPSKRFSGIENWYIETRRVWK